MVANYGFDLKFIVLKLLSRTPMHGYKLASEIETLFKKKPSNGALKPLLVKLENSGMINTFETVEHGKYKKIYNLTTEGRKFISSMTMQLKNFIAK